MKITTEKKAYWFQHNILVEGSLADWQRVVGAVALMTKRALVRDPIFLTNEKRISLFFTSLHTELLHQSIQEELNGDERS